MKHRLSRMYYNREFHLAKELPSPEFSLKAKNIILLIGDGMGLGHWSSALIANKGQLNVQHLKHIGFMGTRASDEFITDSAAAATAIATGKKTKNGAVGVDPSHKVLPNIREYFSSNGMKTGVMACCSVTEATPAAFVAHQPQRMFHEDIALDFLNSDIDFFLGEGREHFDDRNDGKDLTLQLMAKGYEVIEDWEVLPRISEGKIAGLLRSCPSIENGRGNYLSEGIQQAIRFLNQGDQGFFLMAEGSQIDWAAHGNEVQGIIEESLDFDKAIGEALAFAAEDGETLVIVTSDHETGGMTVHDGCEKAGKVAGAFTTVMHTGIMVPVFAYGPQASLFQGIYENTDLYSKMKAAVHAEASSLISHH